MDPLHVLGVIGAAKLNYQSDIAVRIAQHGVLKYTVQANSQFKQIFSLGNPDEQKKLSRASGETMYYHGGQGVTEEGFLRASERLLSHHPGRIRVPEKCRLAWAERLHVGHPP